MYVFHIALFDPTSLSIRKTKQTNKNSHEIEKFDKNNFWKKKNPFINSSSNNLILNIKGHKIKN